MAFRVAELRCAAGSNNESEKVIELSGTLKQMVVLVAVPRTGKRLTIAHRKSSKWEKEADESGKRGRDGTGRVQEHDDHERAGGAGCLMVSAEEFLRCFFHIHRLPVGSSCA